MASGEIVEDFVATALAFLGMPYLWGGRTSLGLDCSGLVQVALSAAGIACPRDSDMQEAEAGGALDLGRVEARALVQVAQVRDLHGDVGGSVDEKILWLDISMAATYYKTNRPNSSKIVQN